MRSIRFGSLAFMLAACGGSEEEVPDADGSRLVDSDGGGASADGGSPGDDCDLIVADADCDETLAPFVFVHGTFGSATEVSNVAHLFGSNGYCQDRFVAIEYDSVVERNAPGLIAELVDQIRADTGFDQVVLAGHSQGTGHACTYLSDPDNRAKVSHYINISGGCAGHGVPTLSVSSENDGVGGRDPGPIHPSGESVTQVTLEHEDHVAVAGSKEAFIAIYKYLFDKDPDHTTIQCGQNPVILDGKVVTFGDNVPRAGATVELFEVDALDHPWERGEPSIQLTTDAEGHFHIEVERNVQYEVRISSADGELLGYGYPGPFVRSNYLTRFLTPSENQLIASQSTDQVVRGPNHVGLVARYVAGAFRKDWNNSLKIDGQEILTEENAPRVGSVVGLFMYDDNENGESDFGVLFSQSFLRGTDVFLDASSPRWMTVEWTNEENRSIVMKMPNWPSEQNLASLTLPYP